MSAPPMLPGGTFNSCHSAVTTAKASGTLSQTPASRIHRLTLDETNSGVQYVARTEDD